jgi:NitT/TauT family transport system ATP-binding protein
VNKVFRRADGPGDLLAVDRLSFEVAQGEIIALFGKTGCGKSTMFNLIAALDRARVRRSHRERPRSIP